MSDILICCEDIQSKMPSFALKSLLPRLESSKFYFVRLGGPRRLRRRFHQQQVLLDILCYPLCGTSIFNNVPNIEFGFRLWSSSLLSLGNGIVQTCSRIKASILRHSRGSLN